MNSSPLQIRTEQPSDRQRVEEITRRAFWNLYIPGCTEHYLVHIMRAHPDFIPELDLVAELDGQVVGNIMYTRNRLTDEHGAEKAILTFGPVSITPELQRRGYGRQLMAGRSWFCCRNCGIRGMICHGYRSWRKAVADPAFPCCGRAQSRMVCGLPAVAFWNADMTSIIIRCS